MTEAVAAARAMAERADVFLPDQFSNPANPEVHRRTTGPEIARRSTATSTCSSPASAPAARSRGGRGLREPQPRGSGSSRSSRPGRPCSGRAPGPHRIQGIGAGFVPAVLNRELIDEVIPVATRTRSGPPGGAPAACGVLAGISCGAALFAALEVAAREDSPAGGSS